MTTRAYEPHLQPRRPLELLDTPRLHAQLLGLERRTACGGRDSIDHAPGAHDDVANAVAGALAGRTRVAGSGAAHVLPPTAASPPRRGSRSRSRAPTKDMGERLAPRPPSAARPRTVLCSTSPVSHSFKHWDIVTESVESTGRKDLRYTNFRRPDVRLLIRAARRGWCGGGAAWRRLRASQMAEAPRAAGAARRGCRERKRRRRAERLQRRRLPAASGSCAQLTAGAAGVVCVHFPARFAFGSHAACSGGSAPAQ